MESIKGGFALNDSDEKLVNQQRSITAQINNNFIQVGAVYLQMSGKNPYTSDWYKRKFRDTNLQEWIDSPDMRVLNLGFNLQLGWLDVDIDSPDPKYKFFTIRDGTLWEQTGEIVRNEQVKPVEWTPPK